MSGHRQHEKPFQNEVQQLIVHLAALAYFLSYTGDKAFHFFATLKIKEKLNRTRECEENFANLKAFMESSPNLTHPIPGFLLYLYMCVID